MNNPKLTKENGENIIKQIFNVNVIQMIVFINNK